MHRLIPQRNNYLYTLGTRASKNIKEERKFFFLLLFIFLGSGTLAIICRTVEKFQDIILFKRKAKGQR